ncbi:MAG: hypothetical protein ICV64_11970 [Thermoleophilia bacterium]|nr:hypothetical protein [Thermoleophilia bacterium]
MPVETPSLFAQVIEDHLRLKARNSTLEDTLPIDRYKTDDPFDNHPLFKTEQQARLEETGELPLHREASMPWPGEDTGEIVVEDAENSLWGRSRDFDWGD